MQKTVSEKQLGDRKGPESAQSGAKRSQEVPGEVQEGGKRSQDEPGSQEEPGEAKRRPRGARKTSRAHKSQKSQDQRTTYLDRSLGETHHSRMPRIIEPV